MAWLLQACLPCWRFVDAWHRGQRACAASWLAAAPPRCPLRPHCCRCRPLLQMSCLVSQPPSWPSSCKQAVLPSPLRPTRPYWRAAGVPAAPAATPLPTSPPPDPAPAETGWVAFSSKDGSWRPSQTQTPLALAACTSAKVPKRSGLRLGRPGMMFVCEQLRGREIEEEGRQKGCQAAGRHCPNLGAAARCKQGHFEMPCWVPK